MRFKNKKINITMLVLAIVLAVSATIIAVQTGYYIASPEVRATTDINSVISGVIFMLLGIGLSCMCAADILE